MKNKTKRFWYSVFTNVAFPALTIPFLEFSYAGIYVAVAMIGLMVCSGGFHWFEHEKEYLGDRWRDSIGWRWQKADEIAMYFAFWSLFAYIVGGGVHVLAMAVIIPTAMAFMHDEFHNSAIGVLALMVITVRSIQRPWLALTALLTYILALAAGRYAERTRNEKWHGVWHIIASTAKTQLII